ncbi:hypothetical protein [Algoriphagus sp. AK58]|uniref:hypothetical protein n=1 Tax=Algoriphagus sp. AK58 TaxID=1406877 RepID=UPI00164F1E45|nr:hypothetical protein [Algoriphagus sp. AK58]MBC6366472.1 hypothetical protein [Algoriphagus sp. AK58]
MKDSRILSSQKTADKGRPDYYITPTHDFKQYTRDCEEKYWSRETAFDWSQNLELNLKENLENLQPEELHRITFLVLPMIKETIRGKIDQIKNEGLPLDSDALKGFLECIPFDKLSIHEALQIQSPLKTLEDSVSTLKDQLDINQREETDLLELQRLSLVKDGNIVKHLSTEEEKRKQESELIQLKHQKVDLEQKLDSLLKEHKIESERLRVKIQEDLHSITPEVLLELEDTYDLIQKLIASNKLPEDKKELDRLKDLILKRQLRGLKDLANHALVVEQSAIAPLSMGIIHYKRYREIQEAMTTFIHDEAKHSAVFRRFLVEKLNAKEYISPILIRGANRYMWLARFMPATGMFLAVIVEAIGAAYLEFFGNEKYMPDKLFCSISKTISMQDEKRHMDLCVAMYNELFREGSKWEQIRNKTALKVILKSVYGDKSEDHHLIQAFRAFGVEYQTLYRHIIGRLSEQLARIGLFVKPEELLEILKIK